MKNSIVFLILLVCASVTSNSEPVRFATYNIQDLFTYGSCRYFPCPERATAIGALMNTIGADIWAIQEIRKLGYLKDFISNTVYFDPVYSTYIVLEENADGDYRPGIISRYPIVSYINHKDDTWTYNNKTWGFDHNVMEAEIDINGQIVTVMSVHLSPNSSEHRAAEGYKLKNIIEAFPSDHPVIVMGDFNDRDYGVDPNSPASRLATCMTPVDALRPSGLLGTRSRENNDRIDFIFISNHLVSGIIDYGVTVPYEIVTQSDQVLASDHVPVWLEIAINTVSGSAPVILPIQEIYGYEGELIQFDITVTDEDSIDTITLSAQEQPQGAILNKIAERSWQFSWQTDFLSEGNYSVTFVANDAHENSDPVIVNITIDDVYTGIELTDKPAWFMIN